MSILNEIVEYKKAFIAKRLAEKSLEELKEQSQSMPASRGFADNLSKKAEQAAAVIAEIKRGSPSLGCIRPDMDAVQQAVNYQEGSAAAISCLTDEKYFFGSDQDYLDIRQSIELPMLRKEFIIDPYQVYESKVLGADCILIIMAILSDDEAVRLTDLARTLAMDVLVETHNEEEIQRALKHVDYSLIGINNRNLKTFETSIEVTLKLADLIPDRSKLVAESGIHSPETIARFQTEGIDRFLVGEAFVKSDKPVEFVNSFVNASNNR